MAGGQVRPNQVTRLQSDLCPSPELTVRQRGGSCIVCGEEEERRRGGGEGLLCGGMMSVGPDWSDWDYVGTALTTPTQHTQHSPASK